MIAPALLPEINPSFIKKINDFVHKINDEENGLQGTLIAAYEFGSFLRKNFGDAPIEPMQTILKPFLNNTLTINNIRHVALAWQANEEARFHINYDDTNLKTTAAVLFESNVIRGLCCFDTLLGEENQVPRLKIAIETLNANASRDDIIQQRAAVMTGAKYISDTLIPLLMHRLKLESSFNDIIRYGKTKLKEDETALKGTMAIKLGQELLELSSDYFINFHQHPNIKSFKNKCTTTIASASTTLGAHTTPEWLRTISKLTQVIIGVVTLMLPLIWLTKKYYSSKTTGRATFFHDVTIGQGKLDQIEKRLENFSQVANLQP